MNHHPLPLDAEAQSNLGHRYPEYEAYKAALIADGEPDPEIVLRGFIWGILEEQADAEAESE